MATRLDIFYAKFMFRFDSSKRFATYRKLSSLLRNDFTLMDALSRIERIESKDGVKPDEPFALSMRSWQTELERGRTFSDATHGWVPINESLMLSSGDMSKLYVALDNVVRVGEGTEKIKSSMLNAVLYPLFLLALTFAIIIMVGIYLVPPLQEAAGGDVVWRGTAASLVNAAKFSNSYWPALLGGFAGLCVIIWLSLPRWYGRARAVFDKLPPWNMYKISASVGWLMSLSAMVAGGSTLPASLRVLADNSSSYVRDILERALKFIGNGDNLGRALANTGRDFPNDEIIGDLAIYADMSGFDQNLQKIADTYLDESVRKIESLSGTLNNAGIILVSLVIGWVVFGTFEMQDQITAALS